MTNNGCADWVDGDRIARHILWLRRTRTVQRGSRFLVEGWESPFHRHLHRTIGINHDLLAAITVGLCDKERRQLNVRPGLFAGDGRAFASKQGVLRNWPDRAEPKGDAIIEALRGVAIGRFRLTTADGNVVRVWELRPDDLLLLAEEFEVGSTETLSQLLETPAAFKLKAA